MLKSDFNGYEEFMKKIGEATRRLEAVSCLNWCLKDKQCG